MKIREIMNAHVVTVGAHETLPDAVVKMGTMGVKRLPVVHEGAVVGILTDGEVRRALPKLSERLTPWDFTLRAAKVRVRDAMLRPPFTIDADADLDSALRVLLDRRVGGLPVLDEDGRLVGILTLTDVLKALAKMPRNTWGAVREFMTESAVHVTPTTTAAEAAAKLKVAKLRVLPVVKDNAVAGVLHEKDVKAELESRSAAHGETTLSDQFFLGGVTVADLMRPASGSVLASVPLRDAITEMTNADVHGLPVLSDGGRLLGVITVSDVLKAVLAGPPA